MIFMDSDWFSFFVADITNLNDLLDMIERFF